MPMRAKQMPRRGKITRPSAAARLYGYWWAKAARLWLTQHPLCAECTRHGRTTPAVCVDHVRPHDGDQRLFRDPRNWQSLCATCHARKTAGERNRK